MMHYDHGGRSRGLRENELYAGRRLFHQPVTVVPNAGRSNSNVYGPTSVYIGLFLRTLPTEETEERSTA